ncbi:glutaminase domain-containing protein [Lacticaseibacillus yichunensis]|uniref:Glutaminase domain-containing protein n=1 Tax=Lacticaseibacillus yichunensis TaxID=2486015 RepID=A0ABW4CRS4_9LACO|nr:DUF4965 domain-containing protein [Lacticaseibacillus yichunensis]
MVDRIPSVPLIVHDPYFSIWSPADHLNDRETESWNGKQMPIRAVLRIAGQTYSVIGENRGVEKLPQVDLSIQPTETIATFQNKQVNLTLTFAQHFDLADLEAVSEPVTYFRAALASADGKAHDAELQLTFDSTITYESLNDNRLIASSFELAHSTAVMLGKARQTPLNQSGDLINIDWGYLYLAASNESQTTVSAVSEWNDYSLKASMNLSTYDNGSCDLLIAYDDVASINYFGLTLNAYWKKQYPSLLDLLDVRSQQIDPILAHCAQLNESINKQATTVGGDDYRLICATAYRQSIAAHKLVEDENGELLFLSKECNSNGCIATVDVSYPSTPLYLAFNPQLVEGMLRPIFRFASLPVWPFAFAPHDAGRYPYATGQVYGMKQQRGRDDGTWIIDRDTIPPYYTYPASSDLYEEKFQMPVEECGDMIIMSCAADALLKDGFVRAHKDQLIAWSDFLIRNGQDPENQLCTDDFAGHLAHNVNLSLKAIVALGALGKALLDINEDDAKRLTLAAQEMAAIWEKTAANDTDTRLAFDQADTWSLKYNLVWDDVLHLNLFTPEVKEKELARYAKEANDYGTPLDPRAEYTKADWLMWVGALAENRKGLAVFTTPLAKFLHDTTDRVPFSDWYHTTDGHFVAFKNRTVIGGTFMPLLKSLHKFRG